MAHTVKRLARGNTAKVNSYNGPSGELIMDTDTNELVLQNGTTGGQRLAKKVVMTGATAAVAGNMGLAPAPAAGDNTKFLRGDGTWQEAGGGGGYIPTLSVSENSVSVTAGNIATVTFTTNSDGTPSVHTSDASIATVTVSGNTITITGQGNGSAIVTLEIGSSSTYYGVKADIAVTSTDTSLEATSWADIKTIGNAGTGANYWDIGDTKSVALSGTVGTLSVSGAYYLYIIDFNHRGTNGVYFQGFKKADGTDLCLTDANYNTSKTDGTKAFNMNHWGNSNIGGWKACDLRYDILGSVGQAPSGYGSAKTTSSTGYDAAATTVSSPVANTLMAALPAALRNVLAPWTVYTDNKGNHSSSSQGVAADVTTSVDYLPLLSEFEVHGTRSYANQYEQNQQTQMAYYTNGNSKVKYRHNADTTAAYWRCRSPYYLNASYFGPVDTSGTATTGDANRSYGLAPALRVA